ncbi:hypothetical protein [Saccharicrinis sp. FJH54]|uniref:hypothetical protein n=1 Tax=Saccharicrinis sp. FJH54 TaxID=3344665 RepID=UPI0035D3DE92
MKRFTFFILTLSISLTLFAKTNKALNDSVEIKNIGHEILNGTNISQIDEDYIYKLISNIIIKDSVDRAFYFKVFEIIYQQLPEYVAQGEHEFMPTWINTYIKLYCLNYPNDFFNLTDTRISKFALEIGELLKSQEEDPKGYAKEYLAKIKEKCNSEYLEKFELFSKNLIMTIDK